MRIRFKSNRIWRFIHSGSLLLTALIVSYPLVWMVFSSLKTNTEIFQTPWSLPQAPQWQNFAKAWETGALGRYFLNSLWVTGASVGLTLIAGSLIGYAIGRMKFIGKAWLQALFLAGLVLPFQAAVIPLFFLLKKTGLHNHLLALILCYAAWGLPLAVFILRSFFAQIPKEFEEAGRMDGCGEFALYLRIFLPLCKPALGSVALFSILSNWNELLMAVLFIEEDTLKTLPVGLLAFFGYRQTDFSLLFSGLTLITLPMLAVYFLMQSTLMKGLTGGLGGEK